MPSKECCNAQLGGSVGSHKQRNIGVSVAAGAATGAAVSYAVVKKKRKDNQKKAKEKSASNMQRRFRTHKAKANEKSATNVQRLFRTRTTKADVRAVKAVRDKISDTESLVSELDALKYDTHSARVAAKTRVREYDARVRANNEELQSVPMASESHNFDAYKRVLGGYYSGRRKFDSECTKAETEDSQASKAETEELMKEMDQLTRRQTSRRKRFRQQTGKVLEEVKSTTLKEADELAAEEKLRLKGRVTTQTTGIKAELDDLLSEIESLPFSDAMARLTTKREEVGRLFVEYGDMQDTHMDRQYGRLKTDINAKIDEIQTKVTQIDETQSAKHDASFFGWF